MIIDCHVHALADTPGHGRLSSKLKHGLKVTLMRWVMGIKATQGEPLERQAEAKLTEVVDGAAELDAVVVLALDATRDDQGRLDEDNTHLYVTNDYVAELARRHPKMLFGASVHPYRPDALAELERCVAGGAVLLKWLPVAQNIDPSDRRCYPLYEALAHHRLPLLSHTGGEGAVPVVNERVAEPALLVPALERGVTVIAAHCGTKSGFFDRDYLPAFCRLAREHEHCYGDTSALDSPTRSYAYDTILRDQAVRRKLVHGSDWPILPVPTRRIGWFRALRLWMSEGNWLRRDLRTKQGLGLDDAYWHRAATLLRLPAAPSPQRQQGATTSRPVRARSVSDG